VGPSVPHGQPVVRGTRVPVAIVARSQAGGLADSSHPPVGSVPAASLTEVPFTSS
jgi:hypothetical protein